jgi:hypothetical protein
MDNLTGLQEAARFLFPIQADHYSPLINTFGV